MYFDSNNKFHITYINIKIKQKLKSISWSDIVTDMGNICNHGNH